ARQDAILDGLLAFSDEQQRIAYLDAIRRGLHRLLALVGSRFRGSRTAVRAAFEKVLRRKGLTLTAAAAQRALAYGGTAAALCEFVRYPSFDFAPPGKTQRELPPRYAAFVMKGSDLNAAGLLDLGLAAPVEDGIGDFRASLITAGSQGRNLSFEQAPNEAY